MTWAETSDFHSFSHLFQAFVRSGVYLSHGQREFNGTGQRWRHAWLFYSRCSCWLSLLNHFVVCFCGHGEPLCKCELSRLTGKIGKANFRIWCEGGDSNPYACLGRQDLNLVRLPISPPSRKMAMSRFCETLIILYSGFCVNGRSELMCACMSVSKCSVWLAWYWCERCEICWSIRYFLHTFG